MEGLINKNISKFCQVVIIGASPACPVLHQRSVSLRMVSSQEHDLEELRRSRERQIVEEGRALWLQKKEEEREVLFKDIEELRELARRKMFGR